MTNENTQDDAGSTNTTDSGNSASPADPTAESGNSANNSNQVLVNSQIVDAVKQTRDAVRIGENDKSKVVDSGIAYQKASQAAAFAVQDATDYLRNIMAISSTAQGMALKLFLETQDPLYVPIIEQAQKAVTEAAGNLETVGVSAISVATDFPR
ncbi:MAG: hypothetical protein ACXWT1_09825 [Methylobacter sp.]